ncbi:hypothetical protein BH09SUM1_BH09SUM1_11350 [soil metagenome]
MSIRVLLVYDLEEWILGAIARELRARLDGREGLLVTTCGVGSLRDKTIRADDFDVVHFLSPWDFFSNAQAVEKAIVCSVHHIGSKAREMLRLHAIRADAMGAMNEQTQQALTELLGATGPPIFLTHFGLDTKRFAPDATGRAALLKRLRLPDDAILIGLAAKKTSNEDERKGFDRYWKVLESLREQFGDRVHLIIFGPDAKSPGGWSLKDIPKGVRSSVRLAGFVESSELPKLYSGLDFYLCLSRLEGGPYPVIECMACETTTISTEVGFVRGLIVDGENGFIVDGDNCASRISELVQRRIQGGRATFADIARRGREAVMRRHSWEAVASPILYREIYETAMTRHSARVSSRVSISENRKRVTWLLPVRDGAHFLEHALDSIAKQTFRDFDVLAWENGSTDASKDILRRWIGEKIPGRVVTDKPFVLLGSCLRAMTEEADSELLARMDSDDVNEPQRLATQIAALDAHPGLLACGSHAIEIDHASAPTGRVRQPYSPAGDVRWSLAFGSPVIHPSMLIRRDALHRAGNYAEMGVGQDYDLWFRMTNIGPIANIARPLLRYRVHDRGVSAEGSKEWRALHIKLLERYHGDVFPNVSLEDVMELWEAAAGEGARHARSRRLTQIAVKLARSASTAPAWKQTDFLATRAFYDTFAKVQSSDASCYATRALIRIRQAIRRPEILT